MTKKKDTAIWIAFEILTIFIVTISVKFCQVLGPFIGHAVIIGTFIIVQNKAQKSENSTGVPVEQVMLTVYLFAFIVFCAIKYLYIFWDLDGTITQCINLNFGTNMKSNPEFYDHLTQVIMDGLVSGLTLTQIQWAKLLNKQLKVEPEKENQIV